MNNLINDVKTSARLFGKMRKVRKDGGKIEIRRAIPCINAGPSFHDTVEGCLLTHYGKDIHGIVQEFFYGLSYEKKHWLSFSPESGGFIERANFWRGSLKPIMAPKQYGIAITAIIQWYIHIKQMEDL